MSVWSRRVNLSRLLVCVGFIVCGFALASWTNARADDAGLLGKVTASVPTVEQVLETSTRAVSATTKQSLVTPAAPVTPVAAVDKVAGAPVAVVTGVARKPARAVDVTTRAALETVTKTVSHTTARTLETVKAVAPVTSEAVDEVAAVVVPVVGSAGPDPAVELPEVEDIVEVVVPVAPTGPVVVEPVNSTVPQADAAPVTASVRPSTAASMDRPGSATAPAAVANLADAPVASHVPAISAPSPAGAVDASPSAAPAGEPGPAPASPRPASALLGAAGESSTRASGGGSAELALTPHVLVLPQFVSPATVSRFHTMTTGPVLEPGSRPG